MRAHFVILPLVVFTAILATVPLPLPADEGMWLFSDPPRAILRDRYDFSPPDDWFTHLRRSAVRFNSGGSGSFVSPEGLVLTNHHVGADALQKLSTPERDLLNTGFYAPTRDEELPCVDLELNVLESIEDVTDRVRKAVPEALSPAEAEAARREVLSAIEAESLKATGFRSDVVTLYQGARYHLYRYKRYTDVRLVFAPEKDIAFFGGDPDNFEFPRYDLDICFFRVYEEGQPARPPHYLSWSAAGAKSGDLVFVAGHPGQTDRLNTVAHLKYLRDHSLPLGLNIVRRREVLLQTYSSRSLEKARQAQDELFGYQNTRKARLGALAGLQDPRILALKTEGERELLKQIAARPELQPFASAWDDVARAIDTWRELQIEHLLLENAAAFNSELFSIARTLVRLPAEDARPNAQRLREFRSSNRESLEQQLFSEAPLYPDLEVAKLADSLGMALELTPPDNPLLTKILAGRSPADRAAELIRGSTLHDVATRRALAAGGQAAILSSSDPLIDLARLVDQPARAVRTRYEQQVQEPLRQAYARVAEARFALHGTSVYPDATFTLRLAFGTIAGYSERGQPVSPFTTLAGTFEHAREHGNLPPFQLPERWLSAKSDLRGDTPFNFVSTADIIGGNSGSPVVNRKGELVGVIFDGNIHSLVLDFYYTDIQARAVSVDSRAILEALRTVYKANSLLAELQANR